MEETFPQSAAPGTCSPPVMNISPSSSSPAGPIQAGLVQDRIYRAGLSVGDVTKAGMGRSCRAWSPFGVFSPRVCSLPCPHLQICPCPHGTRLCTGPGREMLGLSGSSGDSPGAAAPMGAAGGEWG